MDKYEFNIKVEQIKKLVNKGDYETAMKIADTIDWRRVRSTSLLTMIAQVYERNAEYQDAKDILLLAYERAPIGKGLLFKLTDLALREGSVSEAEAYYREFCELAVDDPRQNLLRFLILEAKGATVEQLIHSLEKYCQEELDEKWMYHLAELYQQAGMESQCVSMCDRIMLMFGLGKYVDKAMELKLQYAPLTKYQMDLVENREKYEEKLRAVEEQYSSRTIRREPDEEEYFDSEDTEEQDADNSDRYARDRKENDMEKRFLEEDLVSSFHEARAEEELAKEMSMMEPYDEEEGASMGETRILDNIRDIKEYRLSGHSDLEDEELSAAQTAATCDEDEETIIEDWDLEAEEEEQEQSNHLMIEAEDPERGLKLAIESLKTIHRELGTKNPVAKISGENLNKKGIFAVADRLAGKDLVVERASELDRVTIGELSELMEKDETGIIVVLIDTPARMERMHNSYPALADKFQYIGCDAAAGRSSAVADAKTQEEKEHEEALRRIQAEREAEAARKRLAEREEEIRRQAARDAEDARRLQAEREEEMRRQAEREEEMRRQAEYEAEEAMRQAEYEAANAAQKQAELEAEEAMRQAEYEEDLRRREMELEEQRRYEYEAGDEAEDDLREPAEVENYHEETASGNEMDVEEFAQYACKYAAEIDCSISGKSMLALYERAEMMEEDGVPLTKANAEDLIEEAADKAEKRSFGGMFTSKYDKDGLLILKEKHFFD